LNKLSGVLLVLLMGLNIKLLLSWMPRSSFLVESASKRTEIWKRSIHLWQENSLFGTTSFGFHKEYFYHFHEKMPHAHNMVLGIFTEFGSLGGIAFLIVVIINVYKVFTFYLSKQNNKVHLDVFLLSLPVILLTGVFDYVLYSPQVALMAIILLASWDKYTARIPLLDPRIISNTRKFLWSFSIKTSKGKKHSKNSL
jgi:O-antigen ligase